ncbi:NUDIX hydrolase [Microbacterium sp. Marseille-Q6965]|uniref:NUDIX hydrolase n=1 Tax=Microbacterium sp. Marseille-Q6965 TaxID=2965072 RepID=UPI0021B6EAE6|nr:NUDIX hydrolase [Microbacterium sp. Marseille-Q6965]
MTIVPPQPGEPRRPEGPRDPGDAWVVAPTGERYWGRFGAAGLLAVDPDKGVLLQHRVGWSHHGGTWALPGGALHQDEPAIEGALREAGEEAGVPRGAVRPRFTSVFEVGVWRYTTLVADVRAPFDPVISDPESLELAWFAPAQVDSLPLHPGFAASWPGLRALLATRPLILVDAANVVGSVPDGWWRDRAGAAERLRERLAELAAAGVDGAELGVDGTHWFPEVAMVVEGRAREVASADRVEVFAAPGSGDDELVARAESLLADGRSVIAVTSDRELRARLEATGAAVHGVTWLRSLVGRA